MFNIMRDLVFYAPDEYIVMLKDLCKIPFAKTNDGYRFAYWVYDLNDTEEKHVNLLKSVHGKEASKLLEKARQELEEIVVTEDNYLEWTMHKKDVGGIKQYHKIIDDLSIGLIMLTIDKTADQIAKQEHKDSNDFYNINRNQKNNATKYVLNRNNPFADVTIKSQQFFYKTENGGTETLFFNTNNIVETIDKNGRNMLSMHPGFSVSKEHGVVQRPMQKVMFANSITESIVNDEDHIYIHID